MSTMTDDDLVRVDDELVSTLERIATDLERLPRLAAIYGALLALVIVAGDVATIIAT